MTFGHILKTNHVSIFDKMGLNQFIEVHFRITNKIVIFWPTANQNQDWKPAVKSNAEMLLRLIMNIANKYKLYIMYYIDGENEDSF